MCFITQLFIRQFIKRCTVAFMSVPPTYILAPNIDSCQCQIRGPGTNENCDDILHIITKLMWHTCKSIKNLLRLNLCFDSFAWGNIMFHLMHSWEVRTHSNYRHYPLVCSAKLQAAPTYLKSKQLIHFGFLRQCTSSAMPKMQILWQIFSALYTCKTGRQYNGYLKEYLTAFFLKMLIDGSLKAARRIKIWSDTCIVTTPFQWLAQVASI